MIVVDIRASPWCNFYSNEFMLQPYLRSHIRKTSIFERDNYALAQA